MNIVGSACDGYAAEEVLGMRVLVVDDQAEVRDLVKRALSRDLHEVFVASSVTEAETELGRQRPEIVVLDLGLPDGSGEELCRTIRASGGGPAILILTAENGVASRVRCLDSGADDYLCKPFAVAELRARVRALSRRARAPAPSQFSKQDVRLDFTTRRAYRASVEAPVTSREWAILELLAAHAGRLVTRADLLERVWGHQGPAEAASLEVLIGRIRRKLGPTLVRTVRGEGYALEA